MMQWEPDFVVFHPQSRPEQVWILSRDWVVVHNLLDGCTATVSYLTFSTELVKRGIKTKEEPTA